MLKGVWALVVGIAVFCQPAFANPKVEVLAENQGLVWGFDWIDPDQLIFTVKSGPVRVLNIQSKQIREVTGAPSSIEHGQGGRMDLLVDPEFAKNRTLYMTYSVTMAPDQYTTRLASMKFNEGKISDVKPLFTALPASGEALHFGSRVVIDSKGFLFVAIGDRGDRHLAQKLNTHMGKVLRLGRDGSVPKDNPFVNQSGAKPEVWSYGHRNPQGMTIDSKTGELFVIEHGPRGGDEVNLVQKGGNYGWPIVTHGREYFGPSIGEGKSKPGMIDGMIQFVPSIAPSNLLVYRGSRFKDWDGHFFAGALKLTHINRMTREGQKLQERERLISDRGWRIRNIKQGPDGWIYFSTDSGVIGRLVAGE